MRCVGALVLMAVMGLASGALAQTSPPPSPAKTADIRMLLKVSGQGEMGGEMLKQFMTYCKTQRPDMPASFWAQFEKSVDPSEIGDMLVPIYDRHFTHDEIKELIKFWQSPIGQKLAREQVALGTEAMRVSMQWRQRVIEKLQAQMQKAGYAGATTAPAK